MAVVLTNTEHRDWKDCRRHWWLRWVEHLKPRRESPRGPASIGRKVHEAIDVYYGMGETIEARWEALSLVDRLNAVDEATADELWSKGDRYHKETLRDCKMTRIIIEGYFEWLDEEGEDEFLRVIASEEERRVPLGTLPSGTEVELVDRLDARVLDLRHDPPLRRFMDHKTVATFADRLKTMRQDEQMLFYHLVEYLILMKEDRPDERTGGAIYNLLRRVMRTAKATPPFYKRVEQPHGEQELRTFWVRLMAVAEEMEGARARLEAGEDHQRVVYPNPGKDCSWKCEFYTVCPLFDDGSDPWSVLDAEFDRVHPMAGRYTDVWSEDEKEEAG